MKTAKTSYGKKDILLISLEKTFTLSEPHDNYPHSLPSIYGKNKISPKIIVCFEEDYQ